MKAEMKKIIDAVGVIHVELAKIAAELDNAKPVAPAPVEETAVEKKAPAPKKQEVGSTGEYTEESLSKVGYNDLKKIAASLGVSPKGKRDEVVARILGASSGEEAAEEEKPKNSKVADFSEKKAEIEENEDEFGEQADALLEDNDESDILVILKEVGVKGANKKNLRAKLISALTDGLLDEYLDEEDDEDADDDDQDESVEEREDVSDDGEDADDDEDGEEVDETTYFEDYDDGTNDPSNMTKERLSVTQNVQGEILDAIEGDKLKIAAMKKYLVSCATEDEKSDIEGYDDDDVIAAYCELRKRLIDDDGDDFSKNEGEAYWIGETLYQYGHACKLDGDTWISEVSGDEYDAS